ncbi:MAG: hypothetical protein A3G23_10075 [Bacteroidetes bacterium RIFCSPLOWO2_12_FULL_37_12]|nr:MAG: hypothetical protein A3G23_10075 [Bacteroidetes bacterium RIFCSPLOWO2_12_FULL_37_12]
MNTFEELSLSPSIMTAIKSKGYANPTEVQEKSIPLILAGHDIFSTAQTGTGKTAAFALPILQLMGKKKLPHRVVRTLVLAPTRELAIQIADSFHQYGKHTGLRGTVIYGGVSQYNQVHDIRRGVDILVATPGRLLDLMNQGIVHLSSVEFLVFDEADRMLDMGFINDIKRIVEKVPQKRQTMLFSVSLTPEIKKLASTMLKNPSTVEIKPAPHNKINVNESVYFVEKPFKHNLLLHLFQEQSIRHALVFTRTKHGADKLVKLMVNGGIKAQAIHGNKSQASRQKALLDFKERKFSFLVATDVASRGIDVKELSHVVNFDIPEQADSYVHRIGRTGRAGASGTAISLCSSEEKRLLFDIQRFTGNTIPTQEHPFRNIQKSGHHHETTSRVEHTQNSRHHPTENQSNNNHSTGPISENGFSRGHKNIHRKSHHSYSTNKFHSKSSWHKR